MHPESRHLLRLHEDGNTKPELGRSTGCRVMVTGYRNHPPLEGVVLFYGPHKTSQGYRAGVQLDLPFGWVGSTVLGFQLVLGCRNRE